MGPAIPIVIALLAAWRCSSRGDDNEAPVVTDITSGGKDLGFKPSDVSSVDLPKSTDGVPMDTGDAFFGDYGDGYPSDGVTSKDNAEPIDIPPAPKFCEPQVTLPATCNVVGLAAGMTSSFAVMKDGSVRGWGKISHISGGQEEDLFSSPIPKPVTGLQNISQVSIRVQHLLARDIYGSVWAMGQNGFGQLCNGKSLKISGIGEVIDAATPIKVPDLINVMSVAAGAFHSLALDTSGKLYACGYNGQGQLGLLDPNAPDASLPSEVAKPTAVHFKQTDGVTTVGTGHLHSFAVQQSGAAFTWGDNLQNQLGIKGAGKAVFGPTFIDKGFLKLAGGYNFTCFLGTGCGFVCKGDGAPSEATTKGFSNVSDIIAAAGNLVVILQSGDAFVWGDNASGQTGTGSPNTTIDSPASIAGLGKIATAAVGTDHICLLTAGCDVYCAGANQAGQLGNGSTAPSSTWAKVSGLK